MGSLGKPVSSVESSSICSASGSASAGSSFVESSSSCSALGFEGAEGSLVGTWSGLILGGGASAGDFDELEVVTKRRAKEGSLFLLLPPAILKADRSAVLRLPKCAVSQWGRFDKVSNVIVRE